MNFEVIKKADESRYANGDDIRIGSLGSTAFFSNFKLTTSSSKHLEDINHAHILSLTYKLTSSGNDTDDFSFGFERDRGTRRDELSNNKNIKGKYHLRIMLKDVFDIAERQEKSTYRLGYKLTMTRNRDEAVLQQILLMLQLKLIIFTGTYLNIHITFNNKVFCLNKN